MRFFALMVAMVLVAVPVVAQSAQPDFASEALRYTHAQEAAMAPDAGPDQVDALLAFYADDYVYHHPQFGAMVTGRDAQRRGATAQLGLTSGASIEVRGVQVNGNLVSLATVERFTVRADGKTVERPRITVLTFRDGKIVQRVDI